MVRPRLASVNLVVADVAAAAAFLDAVGADVEAVVPGWEGWGAHHRRLGTADSFQAELDSAPFASSWGNVPADVAPGVVVNLHVEGRHEVDALHRRALELGATELKAPWDAFWGARYSTVVAPGPLHVGFMSPIDDEHRTPPPEIADFA